MADANPPPYRPVSEAIRIGQPSAPLADLYYRLIEGSWWRLFALFIGLFILANVGFALLYTMEPEGISSSHDGSFIDSFFFSVQTISTIGYGTMSPQTPTAHAIVTAEAMVGLVGVAVGTGLVFAKFARPTARVLFSNCAVITQRNRMPVLMLRVANARGNEVVEASIRVAVLKTEVSPEGHRMRRVFDLDLLRRTSPIFALSWLVIHDIDENSPLFGETVQSLADDRMIFIVTMTGIDATFSTQVYARHVYSWHDIRWNHRFIDVITNLDDGRIQIDYTKFHDTERDPTCDVSPEEEYVDD
jgi:inward rectifier potassium channel